MMCPMPGPGRGCKAGRGRGRAGKAGGQTRAGKAGGRRVAVVLEGNDCGVRCFGSTERPKSAREACGVGLGAGRVRLCAHAAAFACILGGRSAERRELRARAVAAQRDRGIPVRPCCMVFPISENRQQTVTGRLWGRGGLLGLAAP